MIRVSTSKIFWIGTAGLSMGLFLIQALFFQYWLVDDAGISLAYAMNWAEGHGLVDQPGKDAVEGYSNFLWIGLLAACQKLRILLIPISPKLLGITCCFLGIYLLSSIGKIFSSPLVGAMLILLLPNHPSVVQWAVSGLETGLYFFLIIWLIWLLFQRPYTYRLALMIGTCISLLSLTRPEAILLVGILPILLWKAEKNAWGIMGVYIGPILLFIGGYSLFRWLYFGELLPNTFYAKGWQMVNTMAVWAKPHHMAKAIYGPAGLAGLIGLILALVHLFKKQLWDKNLKALSLLLGVGAIQFLLMPYDHLDWYRYATLFIISGISISLLTLDILLSEIRGSLLMKNGLLLGVGAIYLLYSSFLSFERSREPVVPLTAIQERAQLVKSIAKEHGLTEPTVLTPDVGGFLLSKGMKVYDLPGLCNRELADTFGKDQASFTAYLFRELRPDIITLHGLWTEESQLTESPRFKATYRLVYSGPNGQESALLVFIRN